ncbi:hypothetical protein [Daejeonella sp.]|uniref:hypothetical protein n=1 Tax=Daejeonella sp. TaxID=2805397 RepID=UPI0030C5421C
MSIPAHAQKILASSTAKHAFSDPKTQDVFKLTLTGNTLLKSKATFEIFSPRGIRLYHETFEGFSLSNELEIDGFSVKQEEEYILKRVKEFFDKKNFLTPAITPKDPTDTDYSDLKIWNDIRTDRTAIGFSYLLSYEYNRKIAWSKKLKKTVAYWGCC